MPLEIPSDVGNDRSKADLDFALIADRNAEVGLHVTLYSLLTYLDPRRRARIHLFLKDYPREAVVKLRSTLTGFCGRYELYVGGLSSFDLGGGRGLHFNRTPYAKLRIPMAVDADRVLFLDADLLVLTDLSRLFELDLATHPAAAVSGRVGTALAKDRYLLNSLSISDDQPYFNTGVVLFNVPRWRKNDLTYLCFEFIKEYQQWIYNSDQTVFNAVLKDDVALLPERFNTACYPFSPQFRVPPSDCVLHFMGSPKPWDLGGEVVHRNYATFAAWLRRTAFADYRSYHDLSWRRLHRTLVLARSYVKALAT